MTSWIFPPQPAGPDARPADVLSVTLQMQDHVTVVELDGPVCAYTASHLDAELHKVEATGRHRIIVDASNVRPLCSAGIEVLLTHEQRCAEQGGDLVVRDPRPGVRRVLDALSLQRLIAPVAVGSSVS